MVGPAPPELFNDAAAFDVPEDGPASEESGIGVELPTVARFEQEK